MAPEYLERFDNSKLNSVNCLAAPEMGFGKFQVGTELSSVSVTPSGNSG